MMKRIIIATLSITALSTMIGLPALALSDRFGGEREQTINRLSDRFDSERQQTLDE